jgi:hypothetical protein
VSGALDERRRGEYLHRMIRTVLALVALAVALAGCPKRIGAGTDEAQLDRYNAQLEELRTRAEAESPTCPEPCRMAKEVCDLSRRICELAGRQGEQSEAQRSCIASQEDCARFNDLCAPCR